MSMPPVSHAPLFSQETVTRKSSSGSRIKVTPATNVSFIYNTTEPAPQKRDSDLKGRLRVSEHKRHLTGIEPPKK